MHLLDWLVIVAYLVWIVYDGLKRTKSADEIDGYLLAKRSIPWWVAGLSVMATQLSAITLVGTTGQGYDDGMRFVQFYFGLPIAMIILSVTVVPFFFRAGVYTAYEYLEHRFDAKTRGLATLLFLAGRSLSCGVVMAAPAVILSIVLGWNLTLTVLAIGVPTVVYTMIGGVQAVAWTDVKQMAVIVVGVGAAVAMLVLGLPDEVSLGQALHVAGAAGRLKTLDFSFNLTEKYTVWSGTIAGMFLMLAYFGCDQSMVQRYLTAKSIDEGRSSLMVSAFVKIPLQALILLTGVLVFVFYLFVQPPMLFNPVYQARVESSSRAGEYQAARGAVRRRLRRAAAGGRSPRGRTPGLRPRPCGGRQGGFQRRGRPPEGHAGPGSHPRAGGDRRRDLRRRELRLPDVRDDAAADGAGGIDHRGDLRRRDVVDRRRGELPGDDDRHRRLQAARPTRSRRHALPAGIEAGHRLLGTGGVRVRRSTRRAPGRSSRSSTRPGRSSTGRCWARSSWPSGRSARTGPAPSWGCSPGSAPFSGRPAYTSISYLWYNVVGAIVVVVVGLFVSAFTNRSQPA